MPSTAPPAEPPPAPQTSRVPGERPASRIGRTLAAVFVLGAVGFWFWLILLAPEQEPPDRLDDPTFAEAAEGTCADAIEAVEDLPTARSADSPQERAEVLTEATAILQGMVDELRTDVPEGERDGRIVRLWLDDWDVYLDDRTDYAEQLAAGDDVPFTLTAKEGDQITEAIDGLADANDMLSCSTPLDV